VDADVFDAMVRSLSSSASRRGALAGIMGSALGLLTGGMATEAKKRRKRKKKKVVPPPPPPPPPPPNVCQPDCVGRVCGPNSCGIGSCGDCGPCKNCQGGACFDKVNGAVCGGVCEECQGGQCVPKANGTDCGENKFCQGGQCICPADRTCRDVCCPSNQACARLGQNNFQCVSRLGTCSIGENYCATGDEAQKCGNSLGCFCWTSFVSGETRCASGSGSGNCECTQDSDCPGTGTFCARGEFGGNFCPNCGQDAGFCAQPCQA
jgi:hypothetical protein